MLEGRSASDRMIASPRKICVPGVQACATAGVSTSASSTATATRAAGTARDDARTIPVDLDSDALTLPPDCFSEIVQLVLHDIVDCVARGVDVIAHLLDHIVDWNPVDQLSSAVYGGPESTLGAGCGPARSLGRAVTRPSRALESATAGPLCSFHARQPGECGAATSVSHERSHRPAARRPSSQQQRDSGTDCGADYCRRQQVVLLLTLLVQLRFWAGLAGAVSPHCRLCLRRSPHRSNPPRQMPD